MNKRPSFLHRLRKGWLGDRAGIAAVEFAIMAPVVFGVIAGTTDLSLILYTRSQVAASVNAAANYALVNVSSVTSANASTLATHLASYMYASLPGANGGASATVNNGAVQTAGSGASTTGGGGSADSCYCPSGSGANVTWGGAATCGSACGNNLVAGKFVLLSASKPFTPMFSNWGIVQAGSITETTIVQVQ